jgi:hypothetical protein
VFRVGMGIVVEFAALQFSFHISSLSRLWEPQDAAPGYGLEERSSNLRDGSQDDASAVITPMVNATTGAFTKVALCRSTTFIARVIRCDGFDDATANNHDAPLSLEGGSREGKFHQRPPFRTLPACVRPC